jgi:PAT family acetyl-CoA transporter-like MFS transporter 1
MPRELRSRKLPSSAAADAADGDASDDELMTSFVTVDDASLIPSDRRNDKDDEKRRGKGLDGDEGNVLVLLFLYILQGIPLGLAAAIPLILTNRHVSYKEQAGFSFAYWPFSIKLLWAPIVDSVFISRFGRRKTWLVPIQYLIGRKL